MIYLARHGQTRFNAEGRFQGHNDSPLTELGEAQAQAAGALIRDLRRGEADWRIVASPLGRARRTAEIIAETAGIAPITFDERLMEITLGEWDGLTRAEIDSGAGVTGGNALNWWFKAPGGETREAFVGRLQSWLADAMALPGNIVAVSHGGSGRVIRGLHMKLSPEEMFDLDVPQDCVFRLHGDQLDRIETLDAFAP